MFVYLQVFDNGRVVVDCLARHRFAQHLSVEAYFAEHWHLLTTSVRTSASSTTTTGATSSTATAAATAAATATSARRRL